MRLAHRPGLHDADFSGHEALAELLLLEDHLRYPGLRCLACIHKHLMRAYAYAKEAVALEHHAEVHERIFECVTKVKRDISDEQGWPTLAEHIRECRQAAFQQRPSLHAH